MFQKMNDSVNHNSAQENSDAKLHYSSSAFCDQCIKMLPSYMIHAKARILHLYYDLIFGSHLISEKTEVLTPHFTVWLSFEIYFPFLQDPYQCANENLLVISSSHFESERKKIVLYYITFHRTAIELICIKQDRVQAQMANTKVATDSLHKSMATN